MDDQRTDDLEFASRWSQELLRQLDALPEDPTRSDVEAAVGACSLPCFLKNGFDQTLKGFSSPDECLNWRETELGWTLERDLDRGVVVCHEGNEACLCPMARLDLDASPALCCCTQCEIKRMFQYALGRSVEVEIVHSFVRDGQSCVYKVTLG